MGSPPPPPPPPRKKNEYAKIDFHQYFPIDKIQEDASYRKIEELHGITKNYGNPKLSIEKCKNSNVEK